MNFGKCCKLFYQIVNNSSYLNQCSTFKTFILTPERLDQMTQSKYSFYKYSKATTLILKYQMHNERYLGYVNIDAKWERAQKHQKWFTTMLKSIKELRIEDSGILLDKLPIDIMFDPVESNLQKIWLQHGDKTVHGKWLKNIYNFEDKYIDLQKKYKSKRQKMKILQCVEQSAFDERFSSKFFCIESKHLVTFCVDIDFFEWSSIVNPSLRILTFEFDCVFTDNWKDDQYEIDLWVDTLRFIDISGGSTVDILENRKEWNCNLVESLNFDNTVKNMTIHLKLEDTTYIQHWGNIIRNLFNKTDYFYLSNLNILLQFDGCYKTNLDLLDWIFDVLKSHRKILKHQFKQLIIAIHNRDWKRCDILQWNPQVDDKQLDRQQEKCKQSDQSQLQREKNMQKYFELKNQWLD